MIIKHFVVVVVVVVVVVEKFTRCAKVCKHFFDCAFPMTIGWVGKL